MEEVFGKLHDARAYIQVASQTLAWDPPPLTTPDNIQLAAQLRNDLWGGRKESDRVQQALDDFRKAIESACKPVVVREVRSLNLADALYLASAVAAAGTGVPAAQSVIDAIRTLRRRWTR